MAIFALLFSGAIDDITADGGYFYMRINLVPRPGLE
jgi:hypothetical protein